MPDVKVSVQIIRDSNGTERCIVVTVVGPDKVAVRVMNLE